jgi:hypothetical protein
MALVLALGLLAEAFEPYRRLLQTAFALKNLARMQPISVFASPPALGEGPEVHE